MIRPRSMLVLIALPLVLVGCRKKTPPVVEPIPVPVSNPVPTPPRPVENNTPAVDPSIEARRLEAEARARLLETIYFEYDTDDLRADSRSNLDQKILLLNANPAIRIRIAGHTDERGNDEYNLALGRRRAVSAKQYLVDRGIDASRIETISFGRERPAVAGSSEDAWARNRRDEFEVTAGGDQIRPAR